LKWKAEERKEYLELPTLVFGFRALGEIGDHAEAAAGIFDDGDGGSPSAERGLGRVLRLDAEVFSEVLLHCYPLITQLSSFTITLFFYYCDLIQKNDRRKRIKETFKRNAEYGANKREKHLLHA